MKLKMDKMEEIIKNKICDEGFMKFFKTSNSQANMSHIDIYIQMTKF